jgi:hypothetical protein
MHHYHQDNKNNMMMEHNYPNNNHWIFRNAILHYLNNVVIGDWPPCGPNDDDDFIQVIPAVVVVD